ncbi:pinin/SDK/memA/ protein conserved region-domain-containing protein [Bombardia bombarda]|uniref:Pinin/SDK/memA/ protein conserved region-domain-containing protein n=1 Tax=Bombardia bombarda TaxID=252184 RepID=A0AA39XBB8_9PEZI|nr:pinin/SDK/memA/ protein conserved region-domain-containing protein [Bombardia bombarda]
MVDPAEASTAPTAPTTQKRKASPSPPAEDVTPKRVKHEVNGGNGEVGDSDSNGIVKDESKPVNGPAPKQQTPSKPRVDVDVDVNVDKAAEGKNIASPARSKAATSQEATSASPRRSAPPAVVAPGGSRRNISQEERKRGQRLFGGLLSTLSQTTSSSQQKKRLEIERRQQEKAQRQRAEDDRRRAEKLAKLKETRKIEQVKFDEQMMHTRHTNMLAVARGLQTKSEPKLVRGHIAFTLFSSGRRLTFASQYYRPWELTEAQEHAIEKQVRTAEETIEREKRDFEMTRQKRLKELGVVVSPRPPPVVKQPEETTVGEPKHPEDTNNRGTTAEASARPPKAKNDKDHDENGDEMVQFKEDTVLY